MYLSAQQVHSMTKETLREFVSLRLAEGLYLDYKEALSDLSEKESQREFLKDVTAFANSAGGDLLLGVKEPNDNISTDNQLAGLHDGESLAQDLERLASTSVDPRIPGLRIKYVSLGNTRSCIVVHIPPSLSRPHMVNHQGHRAFYIRHSESSVPMTTHEVREAVLTSASAEARARQRVERRLMEVQELVGRLKAAFLLQAVPLIAPETSWNVLDPSFERALRGDSRRNRYLISLASDVAPRPTIDGLLGRDGRDSPTWETEVHRTGYVSAFYRKVQVERIGEVDQFVVHTGYCDFFRAFCELLKEVWVAANDDLPYLISCAYLNAVGTRLWTQSILQKYSDPYEKREIVWPEHLRSPGEDPITIAEALCTELFNAVGYKEVIK